MEKEVVVKYHREYTIIEISSLSHVHITKWIELQGGLTGRLKTQENILKYGKYLLFENSRKNRKALVIGFVYHFLSLNTSSIKTCGSNSYLFL